MSTTAHYPGEQTDQRTAGATTAGKPLRAAIIGLGAGAQRIMLPAVAGAAGVQIVAACDLDAGHRQAAAARWPLGKQYADPLVMVEEQRPDIVAIATPPQTHFELAQMALENGCHVYCEKPFVASLAQADQLLAQAQARRLLIDVNSQYYQMPIYRRAQELVRETGVGRLYHIQAWQHMYLLPHEEGGWKAALQPRRVLFEFGTHIIDLFCRFFDAYPQAVTARTAQVRSDVDADVCVDVRLDFPGDRVGTIALNRMSYAPLRYFEMRLDCEQASLRTSFGGVAQFELGWNSERKRPRWRFGFSRGGELRLERDGGSRRLATQPATAVGDAAGAHFARFVTAVACADPSLTSTAHMRQVLAILFAAYASAEDRGQLVRL
jgi:predicted dehydrogenase